MTETLEFGEFERDYMLIENPLTEDYLFDLDDEYINKFAEFQIWTLIEEEDEYFIVAGKQLTNRLAYFITNIPRIKPEEEDIVISY